MKRHVKMTGPGLFWSLALVLGGLFLASGLQAQVSNHTLAQPAPAGKAWVQASQANLVVDNEISSLTTTLSLLVQQGANDAAIQPVKLELRFYMLVKQFMQAGQPVQQAVFYAFDSINGPDGDKSFPGQTSDPVQKIYNKAVSKLTL